MDSDARKTESDEWKPRARGIKAKRPFEIEYRYCDWWRVWLPEAERWTNWHRWGRYRSEYARDQALAQLGKQGNRWVEYRKKQEPDEQRESA